jgi:hypothetical protein
MHPQAPYGFNYESKGENNRRKRSSVHSLAHSTSEVEGHVGALGWGLGRLKSNLITHTDLLKANNKLVSV